MFKLFFAYTMKVNGAHITLSQSNSLYKHNRDILQNTFLSVPQEKGLAGLE